MRLLFVFDEECFAPGATVTNFGPASLFTGGDPVTYFGASPVSFFPNRMGVSANLRLRGGCSKFRVVGVLA